VWGKSKKVAYPLAAIALGQWSLLLHGTSVWNIRSAI
jgi:hypothetical protein